MPENTLLVLSTFSSLEEARRVGRILVEERLAACCNLLPPVESIYRWEQKVETAAECLMLLKTSLDRYYQLEARLNELHSYETPEILAFRAHAGLLRYLQWVDDSCRS